MNWTKLGPKEPDFNEKVLFFWIDTGEWFPGKIDEIIQTAKGKKYTVLIDDDAQSPADDPTHFMRITPPKEKE